MTGHNTNRSAENVKREIIAIIREMKDPRLQDGFISIVKIDVSSDKSSCRVFVSALEGIEKATEATQALQSAEGHIRGELGRRLPLKYAPSIKFQACDAVERGVELYKKIEDIASEFSNEDINE